MNAGNVMAVRIRARRQAVPLWMHPAIVGRHVVTNTRAYAAGEVSIVATCQCGWISRADIGEWAGQDRAVEDHWRDVIACEGVAE